MAASSDVEDDYSSEGEDSADGDGTTAGGCAFFNVSQMRRSTASSIGVAFRRGQVGLARHSLARVISYLLASLDEVTHCEVFFAAAARADHAPYTNATALLLSAERDEGASISRKTYREDEWLCFMVPLSAEKHAQALRATRQHIGMQFSRAGFFLPVVPACVRACFVADALSEQHDETLRLQHQHASRGATCAYVVARILTSAGVLPEEYDPYCRPQALLNVLKTHATARAVQGFINGRDYV